MIVYCITLVIIIIIIISLIFILDNINKEIIKLETEIETEIKNNKLELNFAKNLRTRDYLIKTNAKGKLKNKKLIEELFNDNANLGISLSGNYYGGYKFTVEQIINYEFHNIDYVLYRLNAFEKKQEILDKYETIKGE